MAESGKSGRGASMNVDTKLVRELAELLSETGLTEIEVEDGDRKIKVSRGVTAVAPAVPAVTVAAPAAAPAQAAAEPAAPDTANAIRSIRTPVIEVHISNPAAREAYRHKSYVAMAAKGTIAGFGAYGYELALDAAARL